MNRRAFPDPAVVVDLADLRAALASVRPHVATGKDAPQVWERVRVVVEPVNTWLMAFDGAAAAIGLVSTGAPGESGELPSPCDLSPRDAAEILAVFPDPGKDELGVQVRLEVGAHVLTITDCGGMFDGKQLVLPRQPVAEQYPDLPGLVSRALHDAMDGVHVTDALGVVADGRRLAAFKAAAAAYGEPLLLRTCGADKARLLVICGESFIGTLSTRGLDDETAAHQADWQAAWARRLPAPRHHAAAADDHQAVDQDERPPAMADEDPGELTSVGEAFHDAVQQPVVQGGLAPSTVVNLGARRGRGKGSP